MPPKVSVIIPVYNTAPYLRRCLDSVTGQTLRDIEIICVNDGSTDDSSEILREYARQDSRVRVIEFDRNKGVSVARNTGMDAAAGEYLGFVDSDDYVDDDFYEKLYQRAFSKGADIVKANMKLTDYATNATTITTINDDIRKHKVHFNVNFTTAIYKKNVISRHYITFSPGCIYGEDRFFAAICSLYANAVETIDDIYYYYFRSQNNAADTNFLTEDKAYSYLQGAKLLLNRINTIKTDSYAVAYISATFLLELIRIFRISANECRATLLRAVFDLYQQIAPGSHHDFLEIFKQKEPDICQYLISNDTTGLYNYLLDNQTKHLIYLFCENERKNIIEHKQTIPVFLSADDNYAPFVATTIASICYNTKSYIDFYVLDGGITEDNKKRIERLGKKFNNFNIEFIKLSVNNIFNDFKVIHNITLSMYNRFLIPKFKQYLRKVIYLDVDVIVLGDIISLYNETLDGYSIAAAPDITASNCDISVLKKRMDISQDHIYFNSGVMLIDCIKWNKLNIIKNLFVIESKFRNKLTWPDQDILNKQFDSNYKVLSTKYNFATESAQEYRLLDNIVIRHFNTIWKPWNYNGVHGHTAIKNFNDFWKFAAMTPFLLELLKQSGISDGKSPQSVNKLLVKQELVGRLRKKVSYRMSAEQRSTADFLVSVIIPVYAVEAYLRRCLDSVIAQTYTNLEVICVNDCSPDSSAVILEEYAQKDPRFVIIQHKENKGQGAARNTGLDVAHGEYVYFLDSDDWLDTDYIDSMACAIEMSRAEIVLNTNIIKSDTHSQFLPHLVPAANNTHLPSKENISKIIWNVWAHLYKRSFLRFHNIRFFENRAVLPCEDVGFQYISYAFADNIYVIRGGLYNYTVRKDNSTHTIIFQSVYSHLSKIISVLNEVVNFYKKNKIFNKYDIKMFSGSYIPKFSERQKTKLCSEYREYFINIQEHVSERWYLYDNFELTFFYGILSDFEYSREIIYNKHFFSRLRKNIQNKE